MQSIRSMRHSVRVFVDRYPLIGPTFWMLSIQYYLTQVLVAADWVRPYSLRNNTISDLGNTACAIYNGHYLCSPLHVWMNSSFVLLGLTMIAGSGLIYREFKRTERSAVGFGFMALAGLGTVLVGLFPENTIPVMHELGAALPFVVGNLALVILGLELGISKWLKIYSVTSGIVALVALLLLLSSHTLGLGNGGMERVVAYPQTIWLIVFGIYMSSDHYKRKA